MHLFRLIVNCIQLVNNWKEKCWFITSLTILLSYNAPNIFSWIGLSFSLTSISCRLFVIDLIFLSTYSMISWFCFESKVKTLEAREYGLNNIYNAQLHSIKIKNMNLMLHFVRLDFLLSSVFCSFKSSDFSSSWSTLLSSELFIWQLRSQIIDWIWVSS